MPRAYRVAILASFALLTFGAVARAQTYITTDTMLTAANPISGDADIGVDANYNYSSPAVRLLPNGSVSGSVYLYSSSSINVSGGSISAFLFAYGSNIVNVSGGSIGSVLYAYDTRRVNVSGGSIGSSLSAFDSSTVNYSGGSVGGDLNAALNSTVNYSGGSVSGGLFVVNSSALNLFGTNQTALLLDPAAFGGLYSLYSVSGTLSDGTLLVNKFLNVQNGTSAHFTLNNTPAAVPEPGSVALLLGTITGAGMTRRRKKEAALSPLIK